MNILKVIGIPFCKKGSGIHIKKQNRGKFTEYCNGKVTQECIDKAKKSKDPKVRKRAVFADNARKWKHQQGGSMKKLDIKGMRNDAEFKKHFNLYMHDEYLNALQDSLINRKAGYAQRVSVLGMAIPENGGRPTPHGNGAVGIMGWRGDRAVGLPKDFGGQAHHLMLELFENPKGTNWTHGGKGTNVQTGKEMRELWNKTQNVAQATNALMKGYVRPETSEHARRQQLVNIIKRHMK